LGGSLVGRLLVLPPCFFADGCDEQHELFPALLAVLPPPDDNDHDNDDDADPPDGAARPGGGSSSSSSAGRSSRGGRRAGSHGSGDRGWAGLERALPGVTAQLAAYLAAQRAHMRRHLAARSAPGSSHSSNNSCSSAPEPGERDKGPERPTTSSESAAVAWVALSHRFPMEFWEAAAAQIAAAMPEAADDRGSEAV
jgi:hypothetical protein